MPRRTHESWRSQTTDITINTYANSNVKTNKSRIRKGALIRPEQVAADPQPDDNNDDEPVRNGRRRTRESKLNQEVVDLNHVYSEYPMDFWWTLSEYIAPDDVGRFALICKATYAITGSVKFWKHLYKQYYRNDIRLPTRLQPDCMARPGGIRACVIRYLYYIYTPFLKQVLERPHRDFHKVTNLYVELFWFTRMATSKWLYFYKLKRKPMDGSLIAESEQLQRGKQKSLKSLRDVYMNSEEGCSLMIIQTTIFHPLPRLSEEMEHEPKFVISSIGQHLSRSCNHYRLELKFANASKQTVASVCYEPAISVEVYDWWTPNYYKYVKPGYQNNLEFLNEDKDPPEEIEGDDYLWNFNFAQFE